MRLALFAFYGAGTAGGNWIARGEPSALQAERDLDQQDEGRHFDKRADDGGEGGSGVEAEDGDGNRDGQFEVVAGGGEGERGRLGVIGADLAAHPEADEEHDDEVDEQRHGDAQHIEAAIER